MSTDIKKMIADFEILDLLGQGGMGAVYRARQVSLDRMVALKVLTPKLASDEKFKARFIREARVCAKLNHVHIINGIECGEADGITFFAMEYVDGVTAKQLLKQHGKLSLEKIGRIASQIADALIYVEKCGIIHRDIKPDNIMVTHDGVAKLCDLGLAKLTESEDEPSSDRSDEDEDQEDPLGLTGDGQALGTPYYISPEQAQGQKKIDIRADIYCLGGTLYHLMTGKPPFTGGNALSIMGKHLTETAPGVCEQESSIPDDWGWIITKMMAKSAKDRYVGPKELYQDIQAAINAKPVQARAFKGKSSCLPPKAGRKNIPQTAKTTASVTPIPVGTGSKKAVRAGHDTASSATFQTTKVSAARDSRASVREGHSNNMLILGGVAAVVLLLIVVLVMNNSQPNTAPAKPKPTQQPVAPPRPAPRTEVYPTTPPRPPETVAIKRPVTDEAIRSSKPPEAPKESARTLTPEEASREKVATDALEKARTIQQDKAGEYREILEAYDAAVSAAANTSLAEDAALSRKAELDLWSIVLDEDLKKMKKISDAALNHKDYAAAVVATDKSKIKENLRIGDWENRLNLIRKPICDAVESEAAKILNAALTAAATGEDIHTLEKAAEIAQAAVNMPTDIAPSAARAIVERDKWLAAAALKKQLVLAREKLPPTITKIALLLKERNFVALPDLLEKQIGDPALAEVKDVLKHEKEELLTINTVRKAAIEVLRKKAGEKIELHRKNEKYNVTLAAHANPARITLGMDGGASDIGPEALDPQDVLLWAPVKEDGSDLKARAFLLMATGDILSARAEFIKAKTIGKNDFAVLYIDYLDALIKSEAKTH